MADCRPSASELSTGNPAFRLPAFKLITIFAKCEHSLRKLEVMDVSIQTTRHGA
jgi:hypothetical protein